MAISPIRPSNFLQEDNRRKTRQNFANFRLRTGQKFPDMAREEFLKQQLVSEQQDKQGEAKTALEFRKLKLQEKELADQRRQAEADRAERRSLIKEQNRINAVKVAASIASSFS